MTGGGSRQLRMFRIALRDGLPLAIAAQNAGFSMEEARLTQAADEACPPPAEAYEPMAGTSAMEHDMARTAKSDAPTNGEIPAPDFERAIGIIKTDLNPLLEQSAKIRGDQSAAKAIIEKDCHCNKKAMNVVHQLMRMDPELRDDFLRTLYGGMEAAGIGIQEDMVDAAEGKSAPRMPRAKAERPSLATVN